MAIRCGHLDAVQELIQSGMSILELERGYPPESSTAASIAIKSNNIEALQFLKDIGVNLLAVNDLNSLSKDNKQLHQECLKLNRAMSPIELAAYTVTKVVCQVRLRNSREPVCYCQIQL